MNDQLIALIRTVWQSIIASAIAFALSKGIEIDTAAAFAVTWPIVMAIYYALARFITDQVKSTKLSAALTGPGVQPIYLPDEALEQLLAN